MFASTINVLWSAFEYIFMTKILAIKGLLNVFCVCVFFGWWGVFFCFLDAECGLGLMHKICTTCNS